MNNILERLENSIKNSIAPQEKEYDALYEKLKSRIEQGLPEYIIKNKKTLEDILIEKLNMVVIKEENNEQEYNNERNIFE